MKHLTVMQTVSQDVNNARLPAAMPAAFEMPARYGIDVRSRLFGMAGTCLVLLLVLAGMLLSWESYTSAPKPPTLSVYDVAAPAPSPAPQPEPPAEPEPRKRQMDEPILDLPVVEPAMVTVAERNRVPVLLAPPPSPEPQVRQIPQPESQPAPAPPPPSNAKPTWEGAVLGALNNVKRYPREARFARQQGVPYIRFVMDREGKIRSIQLERSCGVRSLDQEALALPRRAQPLPAPPPEVKGATIELVVPVEFFMR
ncbi:energy transducer TonB family protein [Novosphingobium kaempferiae]|uniref:energy transducer TonB family protein n=1 Tax=Novosphingobium kaempferiae TaxID=2896849 RepID=UPI001E379C5E|nr:energy transducer TonB [Novosphingobium kaempferiae]